MLKIEIDAMNGKAAVEARGDLKDVTVETAMAIARIYNRLKNSGCPEAAEQFRAAMTYLHTDPESPLFEVVPGGVGMAIVIPVTGNECGANEQE